MSNTTTMVLNKEVLEELGSYKVHRNESYSECLSRVLATYKEHVPIVNKR